MSWLPVDNNPLVCTYRDGIIADFTIDRVSKPYGITSFPLLSYASPQDNYVDAQLAFIPKHQITHFAIDEKKSRLATGAGDDIRIWHQHKEGSSSENLDVLNTKTIIIYRMERDA